MKIQLSELNKLYLALFTLFFVTFGYFYQAGQHNENARLDQTRSISEDFALNIDRYNYNTADVVKYEGLIYPNKAPGTSLLGVPAWWASRTLLKLSPFSEATTLHLACYFTAWFTVGLASALLALLIFSISHQIIGSKAWALFLTLSYSLGSIAFPFATLFFSHQLATFFIFFAFWCIFKLRHRAKDKNLDHLAALAGLSLGFALSTEYPAAIAAGVLFFALFFCSPTLRTVLFFCFAGLIGLLPLALYNLLAFGELLFIPYSLYGNPENQMLQSHTQGFVGVSIPSLSVLKQILISPARGLFLCNPWTIFIIPAAIIIPLNKPYRFEALVSLIIVILFFAFNAGFGDSIVYWGGGSSVGPRHVIPALPFIVVLVSFPLKRSYWCAIFVPFSLVSIAFMLMATATEPRATYAYGNPLRYLFWDNFLNARFALEYKGTFDASLLTDNSVSFNWGKLARLPAPAELLPLIFFWAFSVWFVLKYYCKELAKPIYKRFYPAFALTCLLLAAIPALYSLKRISSARFNHGLVGEYYRGILWNSPGAESPDLAELHKLRIKFNADPEIILPVNKVEKIGSPDFSVEWNGFIETPEDGYYYFATESDDGSAVFIDGKLVVNNWGTHGLRRIERKIFLEKGFYPIRVRYYNNLYAGSMYLLWATPHIHMQPIQSDYLYIHNPEKL